MIKTIIADPPWKEQGGGKIKRGADRHYRLMKTDEIIDVMKDEIGNHELSDDLHLYLWVTNNFLADGMKTINALGFRYITNIVWIKPSFGLGYYFRGQHEICLFATLGRGAANKKKNNSISSVIRAPKRKHSQKPIEFYDLVESRSEGDYLYLFSRMKPRDRWTMMGDEVGKL